MEEKLDKAMENTVSENMNVREREISLSDLCVEFLLHWRMIPAFMLHGGIVLGGIVVE